MIEQMALCLRFYDEAKKELREDFIGSAEGQTTTGEALAEAFLSNLHAVNVEIAKMRGQGYDGAANMSGIYRGVQARIRAEIRGAIYTHCKAHNLNLAIVHASEEVYARNMMGTVHTIANAFNTSAKRFHRFQENQMQGKHGSTDQVAVIVWDPLGCPFRRITHLPLLI